MDKVKVFLVRYCQWVALGGAAAFLLWMVYANVLEKPVTVAVGSKTDVVPGDVYTEVWSGDGPGSRLDAAVNSQAKLPNFPVTPDFHERLVDAFAAPPVEPYAHGWTPAQPEVVYKGADEQDIAPKLAAVTGLPVLPPMVGLAVASGHSNVTVTPPNAPAGGFGQPATAATVDRTWKTISAVLPMAALNQSFAAANVTPQYPTQLLRVVLIRQERDPAGNWGPEVPVPGLSIYPTEPLPPSDAPADVQTAATDYAAKNMQVLLQPAFYTVVNGDKWYLPGTMNPNVEVDQVVAPVVPPPVQPKVKPVPKTTATTPPKAVGGTGGTGGTAGKAGGGKAGGKRSIETAVEPPTLIRPGNPDADDHYGPGGGYGGGPQVTPAGGGNTPAPSPTPDPGTPAAGDPTAPPAVPGTPPPLPQSPKFSPAKSSDITVWAHDDTVESGKTYRYAVKYYLLNPVAGTVNLCKPQSLADVYWIESPNSDWTDPIRVDPDTNFYATAVSGRDGIKFDVFKWKNGEWKMETADVRPGDVIGNLDPKTKTDFTTGWTLVDVLPDAAGSAANRVILLANNNGTVVRKELKDDKASGKYQNLLKLVNKGVPPGGATPPPAAAASVQ